MTLNPLIPSTPPGPSGPTDSFRLATVTGVDPLRVRVDGDALPLDGTPLITVPAPLVGDRVLVQLHGRTAIVTGNLNGPPREHLTRMAQLTLGSGGVRTVTTSGVAWSSRLMMIGFGRDNALMPGGYFQVDMPPDGTVIPRLGTSGTYTVANGEIPMSNWDTLYYQLPYGSSNASVPGNFFAAYYQQPYRVPPNSVAIVSRHAAYSYRWGDGRIQTAWQSFPLANGWVAYGNGFAPPQYKVENGWTHLRGLIKSGTADLAGTLPAGARPAFTTMRRSTNYGSDTVDTRIYTDGRVVLGAGWSANWITLDTVAPFETEN